MPGRLQLQAKAGGRSSSTVHDRDVPTTSEGEEMIEDSATQEAYRDTMWQIEHDTGAVGRINGQMTRRVVQLAIELWPPLVPLPSAAVGADAHESAGRVIRQRIRDKYRQEYGFGIIAGLLLSAVIQAVVAAILRRWWGPDTEFRKRVRLVQRIWK